MQRTLQPEILDTLSPDDPLALHNRRDLRVANRIMGNFRWVAKVLSRHARHNEPILELGAGDGILGLQLAARGFVVDGLDLWPRPKNWPSPRAWHVVDLRTFAGFEDYPVVVGNFIFHQFTEDELRALGRSLQQRSRVIIACETARRRRWHWLFAAAAPLLGANHVTLHDGLASIAAGFVGDELPRALGLDPGEWNCSCTTTLLGAYRMIAVRRS